jgi:hypothetical protein
MSMTTASRPATPVFTRLGSLMAAQGRDAERAQHNQAHDESRR